MELPTTSKLGLLTMMNTDEYRQISKQVNQNSNLFIGWSNENMLMFKFCCSDKSFSNDLPKRIQRQFKRKAKKIGIKWGDYDK